MNVMVLLRDTVLQASAYDKCQDANCLFNTVFTRNTEVSESSPSLKSAVSIVIARVVSWVLVSQQRGCGTKIHGVSCQTIKS